LFACLPSSSYAQGRYTPIVKVGKIVVKKIMTSKSSIITTGKYATKTVPVAQATPFVFKTTSKTKPTFEPDPELVKLMSKLMRKSGKAYLKNKNEEDEKKKNAARRYSF
jgi:hypothetical protein